MTAQSSHRPPNPTLRWGLMLIGAIVVFGGVFGFKAFFAKKTNEFFNNMPQPAVAISAASASAQRWSADGESVGTLVAVNGTDVTTEAGGVVRSIAFEAGQPVSQGAVLLRLNTDNEEAQLKALETSAKLAAVQAGVALLVVSVYVVQEKLSLKWIAGRFVIVSAGLKMK